MKGPLVLSHTGRLGCASPAEINCDVDISQESPRIRTANLLPCPPLALTQAGRTKASWLPCQYKAARRETSSAAVLVLDLQDLDCLLVERGGVDLRPILRQIVELA